MILLSSGIKIVTKSKTSKITNRHGITDYK